MKVEVDILGSQSQIVATVSVDVRHHGRGRTKSELRNCVKVEVAVLGSSPK